MLDQVRALPGLEFLRAITFATESPEVLSDDQILDSQTQTQNLSRRSLVVYTVSLVVPVLLSSLRTTIAIYTLKTFFTMQWYFWNCRSDVRVRGHPFTSPPEQQRGGAVKEFDLGLYSKSHYN